MTPTKAEELAAMNYAEAAKLLADELDYKYQRGIDPHYGEWREAVTLLHRRSAVEAERDALQRQVQEMALQALADDTQHREVEAERDALLAAIPEGCTPADAATLRAANHQLAAERDALRADAERYRWLRKKENAENDAWNLFGPYSSPQEIDAAIDAAMKGTT